MFRSVLSVAQYVYTQLEEVILATPAQSQFIEDLVSLAPELRTLVEIHRFDNDGELLPYVFLNEVVAWLIDLYLAEGANEEIQHFIQQLMVFMEAAFVQGDDATQELIAVSFIENLPSTGEPAAALRRFLGPVKVIRTCD